MLRVLCIVAALVSMTGLASADDWLANETRLVDVDLRFDANGRYSACIFALDLGNSQSMQVRLDASQLSEDACTDALISIIPF